MTLNPITLIRRRRATREALRLALAVAERIEAGKGKCPVVFAKQLVAAVKAAGQENP